MNLLDGKRSLNINIFLKQFRMSHVDIVTLLREGRSHEVGPERLKGLLKLLPSQDEVNWGILATVDIEGAQGEVREKL